VPIRSSKGRENFPQLGGEGERYHIIDKKGRPKMTEAGNPDTAIRFGGMPNFHDPAVFEMALTNFTHSIASASKGEHASGSEWYPKVHEAVRKGIRGGHFLGGSPDKMLAGAGIVAAVSPNMDWERSNIHAFKELRGIDSGGWDTIMGAQKGEHARAVASRGAAREVVRGMSIGSAGIGSLQRAGRIIAGEDPEDVMDPRGGPKTHNFMHNIHDPSDARFATIDGRAFDTMTNRVRPWETGRGISSAALKRGTSRYEESRNVVIQAASNFGIHPSAAQAISWEHVKQGIERQGGTRTVGPNRLGQPYFDPHTGHPAAHDLSRHQHLAYSQFAGAISDWE
jgi:hypothetical protein